MLECDNPNLLFYEGHVDLGGPIKKDKLWFYGAYNHFKINKQVSGVSQSVATDLGIFDNETLKGTGKLSQNNTLIGYYQRGRKQKPERGLSTLVPPESIGAQDSVSWMIKGEWQSVLSNRAFLDVNVGRFTEDWPMKPAVDPRRQAGVDLSFGAGPADGCLLERVHDRASEAAGQGPDDVLPA